MSLELLTNTKPVEDFIAYIQTRVRSANKKWLEVAFALAEARGMYGADSDAYKRLCQETNFSKGTASKLITIASSERLKTYAVKLALVHSWGTLYAVASLNDEKFAELKKLYAFDDNNAPARFISQADVDSIKRGKRETSPFKNFAVIQLDEEALKGALFTGDDCERLNTLISEIENLSEYISIKKTFMEEKEDSRYMSRLDNKMKQIARSRYLEAVDHFLNKHPKKVNESTINHHIRCFGVNREELLLNYQSAPKEAFENVGATYDEASFYDEAQAELSKSSDRFAQRVLSRLPKLTEIGKANSDLKKAA